MKQTSPRFRLHAGTASILLVFVTLCLVSFAVLTLVNANADMRLSERIAERTSTYYAAVSEAQRFIEANDRPDAQAVTEAFPLNDTQVLRVSLMPKDSADGAEKTPVPDENLYGASPRHVVVVQFLVETDEEPYEFEETLLNLPH